jgi:hypothetical protein
MVSAIESVMVRVEALDAGVALLRDELRLTVRSDGRASVGLLAAWRYPVHESVRLVELSSAASELGSVRLARFEDPVWSGIAARRVPAADAPRGAVTGPRLIDFRPGAPSAAADGARLGSLELPLVAPAAAASAAVAWTWIGTADLELGRRFYTEALRYEVVPMAGADGATCPATLAPFLGVTPEAPLRLAAFRAPEATSGGVILFQCSEGEPSPAGSGRVGQPGINLLSCHCEDLDELITSLSRLGIEPLAAPSHVGLPRGGPGRVMVVRGPQQELIELTETAD